MKRILACAAIFAFHTFAARAEIATDDVRTALTNGDLGTLEAMFAEASEEAHDQADFSQLRQVYATLFVTAHRERLIRTQQWLTEYPDSPYAATALAWSHFHRAFLVRGTASRADTSPEAGEAFHEELVMAKFLTDLALEHAPDFLPALDAAIALKTTHIDPGPVQPLVDRSIKIAPSIQTVELAIGATRLNWGGSVGDIISICAAMAPRVPGYDETQCLINAAINNRATGAIRTLALSLLDENDDPKLEYARFNAFVGEWRDRPGAEERAIAYHRSMLGPMTGIANYLWKSRQIKMAFGNRRYAVEAKTALIAAMRERLIDNPQNYNILNLLIDDIIENVDFDNTADDWTMAHRLWLETLELGEYLPGTWRRGGSLAHALYGSAAFDRKWPYIRNQIYYSNHSSFELNGALFTLYQMFRDTQPGAHPYVPEGAAPVDLAAVNDQLLCPMIRVARMLDYVCGINPEDPGCNIRGTPVENRKQVRALASSTPGCLWVGAADIESLTFLPVAADEFLTGY